MPAKPNVEAGLLGPIMPIIRILLTLVIALGGTFLCGLIGSMTWPGVGAIVGAAGGFVVFGVVAMLVIGSWRDCAPNLSLTALVPAGMANAMCKHGNFTMLITVHRAENINATGLLPWSSPDCYITVQAGDNPEKATVVSNTMVWDEQFKVQIKPSDTDIVVKLMDQDIFSSSCMGYVGLEIDEDIIDEGFPSEAAFKLESGESKAGGGKGRAQLILSFDYTDDYPKDKLLLLAATTKGQKNQRARERRKEKTGAEWHRAEYGAVSTLATVQMNPRYDPNKPASSHATNV